MILNRTMKELEKDLNDAFEIRVRYIVVIVKIKGLIQPQLEINHLEDIMNKLDYYKKCYDEWLNHKYVDGIQIIGCTYGDTLDDFEDYYMNALD